MQERAIARGTVVVFDLNDSVGNLFRSLALLMQVRTTIFLVMASAEWTKAGNVKHKLTAGHIRCVIKSDSFTAGSPAV